MPGTAHDVLLGLRLLARGATIVRGSRRLMVLGAVPALLVTVLYVAGLALLIGNLDTLAAWLTGFADTWSPTARDIARVVAGIAVLVAVGAVAVVTFVAVTLAVGGPFYERLSELVDAQVGEVPDGPAVSRGRSVLRGVRDGALLVGMSVVVGVPLFVAGFLPVVGQTAVPVLAALVGGRLLMIELTAPAFERRGVGFAGRRRSLRTRRALTWGVGVPTYLLCAIPFVAILAVPVAAAAATLLAREVHGES